MVFVATADRELEAAAFDAILGRRFGIRMARTFKNACRNLAAGTSDIALAIIDLDLNQQGRALLHGLGGFAPDFPIIAVARNQEAFYYDSNIGNVAMECVLKPFPVEKINDLIVRLCRKISSQQLAVAT